MTSSVVGWLVVTRVHYGQTVRPRPIVTMGNGPPWGAFCQITLRPLVLYQTWQYSDSNLLNRGRRWIQGVWNNHSFRPISHFISKMIQDRLLWNVSVWVQCSHRSCKYCRFMYFCSCPVFSCIFCVLYFPLFLFFTALLCIFVSFTHGTDYNTKSFSVVCSHVNVLCWTLVHFLCNFINV